MTQFRVGDRVKIKTTNIGNHHNGKGGTIIKIMGEKFPYYVKIDGHRDLTLWSEVEKGDSMSKYQDLKNRIEALQNGWDKECDDIIEEIISKERIGRPIICIPCNNENDTGVYIKSANWGLMSKDSPYFEFSSQCEKMSAFRQALLWLLDHSNIKNEKQDKIDALKEEIRVLQKKVEELE